MMGENQVLQGKEIQWIRQVAGIYLQCGKHVKAQALLCLLEQLNPNDSEALLQLAYSCFKTENYLDALNYCERFLKLNRNTTNVGFFLLQSHCYLRSGQTVQANASYRAYLALRETV